MPEISEPFFLFNKNMLKSMTYAQKSDTKREPFGGFLFFIILFAKMANLAFYINLWLLIKNV